MSGILNRELYCTCIHELRFTFIATHHNATKVELMLREMPEIAYSMWDEDCGKWLVALQSENIDDIEVCEKKLVKIIEDLR